MKRKFYLKQVKKGSNTFLFFTLLLFISCSQNNLEENTAVKVYVEKIIIEEKYLSQPDSIKFHLNNLFAKYKTSEEEYKSFMYGLGYKSENWNRFFNSANEYLIQLKKDRVID